MTNDGQCAALNRRGDPCLAPPVAGSAFCYWHDPDRAAERKVARSKGGKARHGRNLQGDGEPGPVVIRTVADIVRLLQDTIRDCLKLENSLQRARTVGYLAGVAVKALEISELEARVAALERALKERKDEQD